MLCKSAGSGAVDRSVDVDGRSVDGSIRSTSQDSNQLSIWWSALSTGVQSQRKEAAQRAWDMFFFVHAIPFNKIESELFLEALKATQAAPTFVPCGRRTLATTRLDARHADANASKHDLLNSLKSFGFLFTSDGWRNRQRHSYHNYLLSTVAGPVFLALVDRTGEPGTGAAIHEELKTVIDSMDPEIRDQIVIGCTDTPSSNRKAWKLLRETYPKQLWIGCMAHEIALLFKDWARQIPAISQLHLELKRITIWIRNHSELLKLFQVKVRRQWPMDKRKHSMMLYMPGDTRMVATFKLVHRALELRPVLESLVTDPDYERASQAALKAYNLQATPEHRVPCIDGVYRDKVKMSVKNDDLWAVAESFVAASKPALYLHRLVDSNLPILGKIYYNCALIAKHLAMLQHKWEPAKAMKRIFDKRWCRWHHPVHTAAYALDPSYATHLLTDHEASEVETVVKKLCPDDWPAVMVQLDTFRKQHHVFEQQVWAMADGIHAYQWWSTFGTTLSRLQPVAVKLLARTASASPCEFNWSSVAMHESQRRHRLHTTKTNKAINVAATHQLQAAIRKAKDDDGNILQVPILDGAIESLVSEVEDDMPLQMLQSLDEVFIDSTNIEPLDDCESSDNESDDSVYKDWANDLNADLIL